jgi:transcriptional regulator with XRE-family HTH domain
MSNISKTLRKIREQKGLTQEKLARLADVSNNTVIKIEAGKNQNPTLETLKRLAKALNISVDDLIL